MSNVQIVITDNDHSDIDEERKVFEAAGVSYKLEQCKTEEDLIEKCQGAVAVLNQYARFTEKVFAALPDLKCVVRYGVGVDNVDLEAASRHQVYVCNVPDYGTREVADQALALFMEVTRKAGKASEQVKAGIWDYTQVAPITRLATYTVGIIGLGRIGCEFAKRAHALGCKVIGYDIDYTYVNTLPELSFVEHKNSLDEVLAESDVISLHCGLNADNASFMNKEAFAKMKDGVIFLNVSRGGLVNEADLAAALTEGKIGAAGIDVTCREPLEDESPLRKAPNILITPHMAWYSVEAAIDLNRKCAEEAVRAVKGEKLRSPVNKF